MSTTKLVAYDVSSSDDEDIQSVDSEGESDTDVEVLAITRAHRASISSSVGPPSHCRLLESWHCPEATVFMGQVNDSPWIAVMELLTAMINHVERHELFCNAHEYSEQSHASKIGMDNDDVVMLDRHGYRDWLFQSEATNRISEESISSGSPTSELSYDVESDSDASVDKILKYTAANGLEISKTSAETHKKITNTINNNLPQKQKKSRKPGYVPGDLDLDDLPPIEDLKISVEATVKLLLIGQITSFVDSLAVIQSNFGVPALDENTVVFNVDRHAIGPIFEIFGPVTRPFYSIRVDKSQEMHSHLQVGTLVYCAPDIGDYTKTVFTDALRSIRGSDASWEDDIEVPLECQDFSDDEEEQRYRSQARAKHRKPPNREDSCGSTTPVGPKRPRGRGLARGQRLPTGQFRPRGAIHQQAGYRPRMPWPPSGSGYYHQPPPVYPPPGLAYPSRGYNPKNVQFGRGSFPRPRGFASESAFQRPQNGYNAQYFFMPPPPPPAT